MSDDIFIIGLDKVLHRLDFLPTLQAGIKSGALYVKSFIAQYPPVRRGKQPPKTRKQRAFLMWAIATGAIDFPYFRGKSGGSQTLGRKWTIKFEDHDKLVRIGNNVSYGPFVQGDQQSAYHKATGWKTTREVARSEAPRVRKYVLDAIQKHLRS